MQIFGFSITRQKALSQPSPDRGGWLPLVRESYAGAWQENVEVDRDAALTHHAVFACMTLIASDIAKLRMRIVRREASGIWSEVSGPADVTALLRKPNHIQTRIQFWENWFLSKLSNGNVYVLKQRDNRGVVRRLFILDPHRVQVLVSESGDVFYRLSADNISGIEDDVIVPASEIMHDRMNCLYHPLIGLSPVVAAGLTAMQGLSIQKDSASFFANRSLPGGILTAPGAINDETAERLKQAWQDNYSGKSAGKVAVLGDGLHFEAMRVTATDSQVIDQLKWSADVVCSTFHVPPYKIGLGQMPTYANIQSLNVEYYAQALQVLIESAELVMDEGLGLEPDTLGVEFEIDGLLRMDTATQYDVLEKAKGVLTLDERRRKIDMGPVAGGGTIYMQQQDHSLEAIAARDRKIIRDQEAQAGGDVQSEALNGAQITALQGLVISASLGEVPVDAVEAIIGAAFPLLTDEQISEIVGPIREVDLESVDEDQQEDVVSRTLAGLKQKLRESRRAADAPKVEPRAALALFEKDLREALNA